MKSHAPRILIVHDWLNTKDGGAEQVLYELLRQYPAADLTTLIFDKNKFGAKVGDRRVKTSYLQYFPGFIKRRPHFLLPFIKRAVNSIKTQDYDIVIASSSAWVKNVRLHGSTKMLVYCYSPARMLWDYWPRALMSRTGNAIIRAFIVRLVSTMRLWDFYTSQENQREFVAISSTVARRIKKFYRRNCQIIYPPVHIPPVAATDRSQDYVVVSVLAEYKNVELAINTFRGTKRKLLIAGDGPDRSRLEELAKNCTNIRFLGRISQADKLKLLSSAKGFIFCSIEDFGITPVEAIACGAPVVALRGGGVSETMVERLTAEFFDEAKPEALLEALDRAEKNHWDRAKMHRRAKQFSYERFRVDIAKALEKING